MTESIETVLGKLTFWENLKDNERALVKRSASFQTFDKGSELYNASGTCLGFIRIVSGRIRTYLLSEEGREITLFRIGADEECALSASCAIEQITFDTHMVAEEDTTVLLIGSNILEQLAENNIFVKCFIYELITQKFSSVMWAMQQLLFLRIDQRIAGFLLNEYRKSNKPVIRTTHEEIARNINSAREVVSRILSQFADEGLVELHRGSVILTDPDALADLAGSNS